MRDNGILEELAEVLCTDSTSVPTRNDLLIQNPLAVAAGRNG